MPVTETIGGILVLLMILVILLGRSFICCSNVLAGSVSRWVGLVTWSEGRYGTTWCCSSTTHGTTAVGSTPITNNTVFITRKSRTQQRTRKLSQPCKNYTYSATVMNAASALVSWWNYVSYSCRKNKKTQKRCQLRCIATWGRPTSLQLLWATMHQHIKFRKESGNAELVII